MFASKLFLETFDMVGCYKLNTIEGVFIIYYMNSLYHGARESASVPIFQRTYIIDLYSINIFL